MRTLRRALIALLAVLVVTAGGWGTWVYAIPHYRTVPRVLGLDGTTAQHRLQAAGLTVAQGPAEHSHTVPVGLVVRTDPTAGARVKKDSTVTVVLSLGPQLVPVPNVTGLDFATAKSKLEALGLSVVPRNAYDDQVPEGDVISQSAEPGTKLEPKYASVTLKVSQGPAPVALPDVTGQSYDVAFATLTGKGFKVKEKEQFDDQVPSGDVISMSPAGGTTQPKGSTVTLTVSKGPETFSLKDFTGETREQAVAELGALGLQVQIVTLPGTPPPDTVVFQDPPAGTIVHSGDTITLYVTAP
jgi:serine/threonine-protein kinase